MSTDSAPISWLRRPMAWAGLMFAAAAALTGWAVSRQAPQPAARVAAATAAPLAARHPTPASGTSPGHELDAEAMKGMVERLRQRLASQPDDAPGWAMLARTLAVAGQHAQAVPAFQKAAALMPDDPVLLADYADALAMTRGRRLQGEPMALVQRALAIAPDNFKALSLAGTEAFDRGDWAAAARHWERLRDKAGPDHPMWQQVEGGLREARERRDAGVGAVTARRP